MTLEEFDSLDMNARAELLWEHSPLDERREDGHVILLYSLNRFYAEVWYDWGDNRIINIKALRSASGLAPYLSGRV